MSVNKKNYSALLLVLSVFTLPGISGKAEAQVTTLRCDGPDFGDECSLNEMYNVAGVLFFTELNFQIAFPFLPPSSDDFNTDLSQVKVIPLEGFPGPGIRIEPLPGTWAIDGNESLSNQKVLAELRMLGGSSSASEAIPTDQVRYKFETTTTYVSGVVPDCDNNFGGSGGFVDGSLSVAGQIIGQAQSVNFGGIEFGAPPDRMDYRNSQGENISQATGEINFQGDLTFLRAVEIFNLTFTVADCGTAAANSAELVAIELRFVDTESLPPDADGDGVPDEDDAFPNDPTEWDDTDADGVGNNADTDDDGDTLPDDFELANGLDPLNAADAEADTDDDGFTNLEEFEAGTDPQDAADFPAERKVPVAIFTILGEDEE